MTKPTRIAFIGNSLPRQCGIATFTGDLSHAMADASQSVRASIVAVTDAKQSYAYPEDVIFEIREDEVEDYVTAARVLNEGRFDVVSLQHEFGIFGGPDGDFILMLLKNLRVPVVTTCHTILAEPSRARLNSTCCRRSRRTPVVSSSWQRRAVSDIGSRPTHWPQKSLATT
ncbi:hypothetical protein ACU5AY_01955 [Rhizobium sp. PAMB 3174]